MNRIVLGLDRENHYEPAARLLARLNPQDAAVDLLHVFEMPTYFGDVTLPLSPALIAEAIEGEKAIGRSVCEAASERLRKSGLTTRVSEAVGGYPAAEIMEYADRIGARLIAVAGTRKGTLRAFLTGNIGRALVVSAHQSVLVAKGEPAAAGPVSAVLATDHSDYANRCLTEFLALAPRGLSHLTVMTCYPKEFVHAIRPFLDDFVLDPAEWIEKNLRERNEETARALAPLGCTIETRVYADTPISSIPVAMKETGADLLILGAQGHGFIERLTLGSTSFHQVMSEPYPVLVLRVPKPR